MSTRYDEKIVDLDHLVDLSDLVLTRQQEVHGLQRSLQEASRLLAAARNEREAAYLAFVDKYGVTGPGWPTS